ncbi:MAG: hypothetical protein WAO95_19875 [Burkholderiales bacterium]
MEQVLLPLQFAPGTLNQPILPNWSFNLFSVNLGASSDSTIEHEVLQNVGSYGKQIGHLAEALEVVIKRLKLLEATDLPKEELDVLQIFLGDVSATRGIKSTRRSARSTASASAERSGKQSTSD